jgi:hypothetical protein
MLNVDRRIYEVVHNGNKSNETVALVERYVPALILAVYTHPLQRFRTLISFVLS